MAKTDDDLQQECTQRFIQLANKIRKDGVSEEVVSAGMLTASGLYATFAAAGNAGGLNPSGVDKVTAMYQHLLEGIQEKRKQRNEKSAGERV